MSLLPIFTRVLVCPILLLGLTSCVDLAGSGLSKEKQKAMAHIASPEAGEVHTMRGGLGVFSKGMNKLRDSASDRFQIPSSSAMWYNAGAVTQSIVAYRQKTGRVRPIILVGHSLGANEQIKVARSLNKLGVSVDLLVTVDAVSQTRIPPNVKHALNLYKPGWVPMFSGLRLVAVDPRKTRIDNINVATLPGMHTNHFTIDKETAVQDKILDEIHKVLAYENTSRG